MFNPDELDIDWKECRRNHGLESDESDSTDSEENERILAETRPPPYDLPIPIFDESNGTFTENDNTDNVGNLVAGISYANALRETGKNASSSNPDLRRSTDNISNFETHVPSNEHLAAYPPIRPPIRFSQNPPLNVTPRQRYPSVNISHRYLPNRPLNFPSTNYVNQINNFPQPMMQQIRPHQQYSYYPPNYTPFNMHYSLPTNVHPLYTHYTPLIGSRPHMNVQQSYQYPIINQTQYLRPNAPAQHYTGHFLIKTPSPSFRTTLPLQPVRPQVNYAHVNENRNGNAPINASQQMDKEGDGLHSPISTQILAQKSESLNSNVERDSNDVIYEIVEYEFFEKLKKCPSLRNRIINNYDDTLELLSKELSESLWIECDTLNKPLSELCDIIKSDKTGTNIVDSDQEENNASAIINTEVISQSDDSTEIQWKKTGKKRGGRRMAVNKKPFTDNKWDLLQPTSSIENIAQIFKTDEQVDPREPIPDHQAATTSQTELEGFRTITDSKDENVDTSITEGFWSVPKEITVEDILIYLGLDTLNQELANIEKFEIAEICRNFFAKKLRERKLDNNKRSVKTTKKKKTNKKKDEASNESTPVVPLEFYDKAFDEAFSEINNVDGWNTLSELIVDKAVACLKNKLSSSERNEEPVLCSFPVENIEGKEIHPENTKKSSENHKLNVIQTVVLPSQKADTESSVDSFKTIVTNGTTETSEESIKDEIPQTISSVKKKVLSTVEKKESASKSGAKKKKRKKASEAKKKSISTTLTLNNDGKLRGSSVIKTDISTCSSQSVGNELFEIQKSETIVENGIFPDILAMGIKTKTIKQESSLKSKEAQNSVISEQLPLPSNLSQTALEEALNISEANNGPKSIDKTDISTKSIKQESGSKSTKNTIETAKLEEATEVLCSIKTSEAINDSIPIDKTAQFIKHENSEEVGVVVKEVLNTIEKKEEIIEPSIQKKKKKKKASKTKKGTTNIDLSACSSQIMLEPKVDKSLEKYKNDDLIELMQATEQLIEKSFSSMLDSKFNEQPKLVAEEKVEEVSNLTIEASKPSEVKIEREDVPKVEESIKAVKRRRKRKSRGKSNANERKSEEEAKEAREDIEDPLLATDSSKYFSETLFNEVKNNIMENIHEFLAPLPERKKEPAIKSRCIHGEDLKASGSLFALAHGNILEVNHERDFDASVFKKTDCYRLRLSPMERMMLRKKKRLRKPNSVLPHEQTKGIDLPVYYVIVVFISVICVYVLLYCNITNFIEF